MLVQISETPTVFNFLERNPINPLIYSRDQVLVDLGYIPIVNKRKEGVEAKLIDIFNRTVIRKQDPKSLFGIRMIDELKRKELILPKTQVLEKDGELFLNLEIIDGLNIIVRAEPVLTVINMGLQVEGFQVENVLITGTDGNILDMMQLRPGRKIKNIITFSDIDSGVSPSRQYGNGPIYDEDVILSLPTLKQDKIWDGESFKHLFLHENSHASILDYQQNKEIDGPKKLIRNEIEANAIAMNIGNFVNKRYPNSRFFNLINQKSWIDKQLNEGYGAFLKYRK